MLPSIVVLPPPPVVNLPTEVIAALVPSAVMVPLKLSVRSWAAVAVIPPATKLKLPAVAVNFVFAPIVTVPA